MSSKVVLHVAGGLAICAIVLWLLKQLFVLFPQHQLLVLVIAMSSLITVAYRRAKRFKQSEGEDGLVIYIDYLDLFRCFSVILVPAVILLLGALLNITNFAAFLAVFYGVGMTLYICYYSAQINRFSDLPVVYLTKFSISILWFIVMFQSLHPSGKNWQQRRNAQAIAAVILLGLIPLVDMFVLNNEGKTLVRDKFKNRRFGGASAIRAALDK